MTLRRQLLLVSLLLLSLPWAGCQFVREMEGALRQGQEQSLQATAQAVAAVLGQREELLYPNPLRRVAPPDKGEPIYAHPTDQLLIVDGYDDGWEDHWQGQPGNPASGSAPGNELPGRDAQRAALPDDARAGSRGDFSQPRHCRQNPTVTALFCAPGRATGARTM